ncbi:MAG: 2-oxoacid:acceptor oxidoreductase family protein [Patescibacteria group bacterium]|jgi:pyruvate ferredoxin oxidoreductase gamma subunit|nr:2-oxoacid:acceptor oxidoreductase family protein [bacterium]HQC49851.1 2-oxoacid:acceptor oxidoreductase family protein [bacterium]
MKQIRIHGRGGQGVVTAAEIIAIAAFHEGYYSQAFPHFGVERSGAPIRSYARIAKQPILTREQVERPDILIIQDHTLLDEPEVLAGINQDTLLIINVPKNFFLEKNLPTKKIYYTPATEIALKIIGKNIVNTVILGAFAKHSGLISLSSLKKAIAEKFKEKGQTIIEKNIQAITTAYQTKL